MKTPAPKPQAAEQGFMLVGLIVAIFLILLVLGVAAPRLAKALRRDREVEAVHRGNQYVRAVQLYYRKVGHYPGSLEQLEKTNNIRFLRQRYPDPMTGKPDWRLIHVGEAKTTVKGFFGKPLSGLPGAGTGTGIPGSANLGSVAGSASGANTSSAGSSSFGNSSFGSSSSGNSGSGSSFGSSTTGSSSFGSNQGTGTTTGSTTGSQSGSSFGSLTGSSNPGTTGSGSSSGIGSQSATSFSGTGAPIVGVSSMAPGDSIIVLNEQTTYPTWEFLYDPRIEQLKAKSSLLSGGPASGSASSFGSSTTTPGISGTSVPGSTIPSTNTPVPTPSTNLPQ